MFKQAPRLLARASAAAMKSRRPFSSDLQAGAPVDTKFIDAWRSAVPNIDPPKTLSAYMAPRPPTPSTIPSKLTINVVLPYNSVFAGEEVDMVIIPASTGQMGVLPGHVATIAELKPGLMSVHSGTDVKKYFVSGGFAFIHANSVADVIAVEAVPIEHFDQALVQKNLADFTQKVNTATNDLEKAEAQIGLDVHSALNAALTG